MFNDDLIIEITYLLDYIETMLKYESVDDEERLRCLSLLNNLRANLEDEY